MPDVAERTDRAHYLADLEKIAALDSPNWLRDLRETAASEFAELEFPHYKMDAWKSTNVKPVVQTAFRSLLKPTAGTVSAEQIEPHLYDEDWAQLVFVDGFFSQELSRTTSLPNGLTLGSLAEAIASGNALAKEHLGQYLPATNAFSALNSAFLQDGLFLHIPKNTVLENPVHVLHVSTGEGPVASYPRNLVILDESAEATLLETFIGISDSATYLTNLGEEFILATNTKLTRHKRVEEGAAAYHLATTQVVQAQDTAYNDCTITLSGQIVRNELRVDMRGENAECELNGLYLNDGDRVIDNALNVEHYVSHGRSRMGYKGVLNGTSEAVFTGKVYVHKGAQKTDSDQLNNNLLLSDQTEIDTRPQLEIFADDVKCTHGATIGGFPEQLVFYFRSRGISEAMANGILTYGFAQEVIDTIKVKPLHERLSRYVFDKYEANH